MSSIDLPKTMIPELSAYNMSFSWVAKDMSLTYNKNNKGPKMAACDGKWF